MPTLGSVVLNDSAILSGLTIKDAFLQKAMDLQGMTKFEPSKETERAFTSLAVLRSNSLKFIFRIQKYPIASEQVF